MFLQEEQGSAQLLLFQNVTLLLKEPIVVILRKMLTILPGQTLTRSQQVSSRLSRFSTTWGKFRPPVGS